MHCVTPNIHGTLGQQPDDVGVLEMNFPIPRKSVIFFLGVK